MLKEVLKVYGMSCGHCEKAVKDDLMDLVGIENVTVSLENKSVEVVYDENALNLEKIIETIIDTGYEVVR